MIYQKLSQLPKILAISLTVVSAYGSLPVASLATPIPAQSTLSPITAKPAVATHPSLLRLKLAQTLGQLASRSAANTFKTPPLLKDRGAPAPGKRVGGGSRGACPVASKSLTALVPIIPSSPTTRGDSVLGLTVAAHPTLWFYFPYALTSTRPVEFILKDDQDNLIYQTQLSESGATPGVVGFKLPNTVPALEVDKRYKWYFTIYCDAQERSDFRSVEGWVQRVALNPSLNRDLEQTKLQQKFLRYSEVGVWYEAVT
ncbi:DUF928 domain-containing protein, partial [Allocoleopsis sp.]|uniref:DUF928 domain-containing protein n=1 Tax=Allocoleopsis sp. TaxID=3088169 RepID=UPI002FD19BBB